MGRGASFGGRVLGRWRGLLVAVVEVVVGLRDGGVRQEPLRIVARDRRTGGGVEGRGFYNAVGGLELGRINVAARGVGVATAALKQSVAYSQQRKTFGKPICEHQAIQIKLADMATRVEAARLLTTKAAEAHDREERCDMEAGMAKLFASEAGRFCVEECLRIHGGYGYSKEYEIERLYRDAPLLLIGEGTSEIQRMVIGKKLLERNKI